MLLIAGITVFSDQSSSIDDEALCDAVELAEGHDRYNALVCSAESALSTGNCAKALSLLRRAEEISLFERPNVLLYPLIAKARYNLGDQSGAFEDMQRAEIALIAISNILLCEGTEDEADFSGYPMKEYRSDLLEEVALRMCWPVYEGFLTRFNIGALSFEEKLHIKLNKIQKELK